MDLVTSKRIYNILFVHLDKPDRIPALAFLLGQNKLGFTDIGQHVRYWKLLRDVWTNSESLFAHKFVIHQLMGETLHTKGSSRFFMTSGERRELCNLKKQVSVYRGGGPANMRGWSWTLDPDVAFRFAQRATFSLSEKTLEQGIVFKTTVRREDISAICNGRSENEYIIPPEKLGQIYDWKTVSKEAMNEGRFIFWLAQTGNLDVPMYIPSEQSDSMVKAMKTRSHLLRASGLPHYAKLNDERLANAVQMPERVLANE